VTHHDVISDLVPEKDSLMGIAIKSKEKNN
jgi:hypothetical protein